MENFVQRASDVVAPIYLNYLAAEKEYKRLCKLPSGNANEKDLLVSSNLMKKYLADMQLGNIVEQLAYNG